MGQAVAWLPWKQRTQGRLAVGQEQLHGVLGFAVPVGPPQESWASSAATEIWLLELASWLYG